MNKKFLLVIAILLVCNSILYINKKHITFFDKSHDWQSSDLKWEEKEEINSPKIEPEKKDPPKTMKNCHCGPNCKCPPNCRNCN